MMPKAKSKIEEREKTLNPWSIERLRAGRCEMCEWNGAERGRPVVGPPLLSPERSRVRPASSLRWLRLAGCEGASSHLVGDLWRVIGVPRGHKPWGRGRNTRGASSWGSLFQMESRLQRFGRKTGAAYKSGVEPEGYYVVKQTSKLTSRVAVFVLLSLGSE